MGSRLLAAAAAARTVAPRGLRRLVRGRPGQSGLRGQHPRPRRPERHRASEAVRRRAGVAGGHRRPAVRPRHQPHQAADAGVLRLHPLPRHLPGRDGQHRRRPGPPRLRTAREGRHGLRHHRPARDTTKVLRAYVDRFDPKFDGLTGKIARDRAGGQGVRPPDREGPPAGLRRLRRHPRHERRSVCVRTARRRTSGPRGRRPTISRTTSARSWRARCTPDDRTVGPAVHPEPQRRRLAPRPGFPSAATRCASSSASSPRSGWASDASPPAAASRGRSPTSPSGRCRSGSSAAGSTT